MAYRDRMDDYVTMLNAVVTTQYNLDESYSTPEIKKILEQLQEALANSQTFQIALREAMCIQKYHEAQEDRRTDDLVTEIKMKIHSLAYFSP